MLIELVGVDCPALPEVTVGVQRGAEVVDTFAAAGGELRWLLEVRLFDGPDLRGPFVHGRPGDRFVYLSWQHSGTMFRRAKLMLGSVPAELLAASAPGVRARFALAMPDGSPLCAAVRPPAVTWSSL